MFERYYPIDSGGYNFTFESKFYYHWISLESDLYTLTVTATFPHVETTVEINLNHKNAIALIKAFLFLKDFRECNNKKNIYNYAEFPEILISDEITFKSGYDIFNVELHPNGRYDKSILRFNLRIFDEPETSNEMHGSIEWDLAIAFSKVIIEKMSRHPKYSTSPEILAEFPGIFAKYLTDKDESMREDARQLLSSINQS